MLYYKDGLTQNEIAKRLGVSRATVINHLRLAREHGIVDIRINGSSFSTNKLSKDIKARFDLEDVYIASIFENDSSEEINTEEDIIRQVARVAAMALCEIVSPNDVLGVTWGKTIQLLAEELPSLSKPGLSVLQMIGSMKSPLLVASVLGILLATLTSQQLNRLRLSDRFFYPPLVYVAMAVIYTVVIGFFLIPA